jgi:hypothetical protein
MAERGDKVRAAAVELESHVAANHALPLLRAVTWLHRRVRELTDLGPRFAGSTDAGRVLSSLHAREVLEAGVTVAQHVQEPFLLLRRDLDDATLLSEIMGREELKKEADELRREMRANDEWLENWERETDEILRRMDEGIAELQEAVSGLGPSEAEPPVATK